MALELGSTIDGKYEILRLLGEGGMGAVYEGRNALINRRVAIKVLHASLLTDKDVVRRFESEAKAAGCIGNDHILEVLDLGALPSGDRYMVLEYLDGETFGERIEANGPMGETELCPLLKQALTGLAAAHRAGIIHRDLKPDNLFILKEKAGRKDFVKIIDFGISKFANLGGDMAMTSTGAVMGTPYYMSPEQAKGAGGVTLQSDVYSMGVIAFEMLTGKVPFDGETFNDLMFKIVLADLPDLTKLVPGMDTAFAGIIQRSLAKDKAVRFQSADEFAAALEAWAPGAATIVGGTERTALSDTAIAEKTQGNANASTDTSWANTQADLAKETKSAGGAAPEYSSPPTIPTKKPPVGLIVGVAAAAALLAGGAFALSGGASEESAAEEELTEELATELPDAEPVSPPAAIEETEPEAKVEEKAPPSPAEEAPKPKAPTRTTPKAPPPAPAAVAPRPAAPRPAAPRPRPRPSTSTTRDFGY